MQVETANHTPHAKKKSEYNANFKELFNLSSGKSDVPVTGTGTDRLKDRNSMVTLAKC